MKTLLPAAAFLILSASIASSAGLNLAWNNCLPAVGSAMDKGSTCDASSVLDTQVLVGSVITGFDISSPNFAGAQSVVDFESASPSGGNDFWHMASGECRSGSFNVFFAYGAAITGCSKTLYGPSSNYFAVTDWMSTQGGFPNKYRLRAGAARNPGGAVIGTVQYVTFEMDMDMHHTDVNDTSTPYCAGCEEAACIVYAACEIDRVGGTVAGLITAPATRHYVTWQGGVIQPQHCPDVVPTHQTTWGQLKSLYR
jgi:hypothetical protein